MVTDHQSMPSNSPYNTSSKDRLGFQAAIGRSNRSGTTRSRFARPLNPMALPSVQVFANYKVRTVGSTSPDDLALVNRRGSNEKSMMFATRKAQIKEFIVRGYTSAKNVE
ncbi:hypothetical protein KPH14_005954 [Odynerus spinipes]|uniref:Uncharacterized protein n=1 Tax=Odynerus spinipes TaxID=1348599 RepID=A0AAD9RJI7_9HYME|nr:hypothetical protein KPH14_005954 [Odynerus spinipes]